MSGIKKVRVRRKGRNGRVKMEGGKGEGFKAFSLKRDISGRVSRKGEGKDG